MDRKVGAFALIVIALLLYWKRKTIVETVTRAGGFDLSPSGVSDVVLPEIKLPALPTFKPGPGLWTQTTGLMCACDRGQYVAPVVINTLEVPRPPGPRYINQVSPFAPSQLVERYYYDFRMSRVTDFSTGRTDPFFTVWGDRPDEFVYRASDGRIFLRPRTYWLDPISHPNESNSPLFVGTNEYRMDGSDIIYGPYRYKYRRSNEGGNLSANSAGYSSGTSGPVAPQVIAPPVAVAPTRKYVNTIGSR